MKRFYAALFLLVFCFVAQSVLAAPYAYITQVSDGTVDGVRYGKKQKSQQLTWEERSGGPLAITMSLDGRKAYVSSQSRVTGVRSWVTVIDVLTHTVTATIPVGA